MSKIARNLMKKSLIGAIALGMVLQSLPTSAAIEKTTKEQNVVQVQQSVNANVNEVVNILDGNLKIALNKELKQAEDADITIGQLNGMTGNLNLSSEHIEDLEGLQYCTGITGLNLYWNDVEDLSPIKGLVNLTSLDISFNEVSDISILKDLKNLTSLDIASTKVKDISVLDNFRKLTRLSLVWDEIENGDISVIKGLTDLTTLELARTKISDISVLKGLINLEKLYLWGNSISDLSPLKDLNKLVYLEAQKNKIIDVEPVKNVRTVYMNDQKVSLSDVTTADGKVVLKNPLKGSVIDSKGITYIQTQGTYNNELNNFYWDNIKEDANLEFKVIPIKIGDISIDYKEAPSNSTKKYFSYSVTLNQPVKYDPNSVVIPGENTTLPVDSEKDTTLPVNNVTVSDINTSNTTNKVEENSVAKTGDVGMLGVLGIGAMSLIGMVGSRNKKKYNH